MPSTLVHLAVGGLVAAGLLGAAFDRRALLLCLAAAAFPDLDTFLGLFVQGGHRAILHTLLLPAALGFGLYLAGRERLLAGRALTVAWAALGALLLGGIGPDLFTNGVNAFWPVHDQFYRLSGEALLSNQRGFVQTFVELGEQGDTTVGTTETIHYRTGVDPTAGPAPENVERVFPLVMSGTQLLLVVTSVIVVGGRLRLAGQES